MTDDDDGRPKRLIEVGYPHLKIYGYLYSLNVGTVPMCYHFATFPFRENISIFSKSVNDAFLSFLIYLFTPHLENIICKPQGQCSY